MSQAAIHAIFIGIQISVNIIFRTMNVLGPLGCVEHKKDPGTKEKKTKEKTKRNPLRRVSLTCRTMSQC